ncbi:MAG: tetratricopeptide repeat protein [bacterium]
MTLRSVKRAAALAAVSLLFLAHVPLAHPFDQTYESTVEALETYRTLIADYPEDLELRYLLGDMQIRAGKLDDAGATFEQLLTLDPGYDMAHYRLAEVFYRREKYAEALTPLEKMKDKSLQDDKLIAMATVFLKLENPRKALELSRKAIETDELNPGGWLHMGLAFRDMGETEKAIEYMEKSFLMDPAQPLVFEWYDELLEKHRTPAQRLEILQRLLKKIPRDYTAAVRMKDRIKSLKGKMEKEPGKRTPSKNGKNP